MVECSKLAVGAGLERVFPMAPFVLTDIQAFRFQPSTLTDLWNTL
jgi:hypothetical protein